MKLKTLVVTVLVLAALSLGVYIARRPEAPKSADARLNQSLVDRALVEKAQKLRISDAGKSVDLARQSDGTWRVVSYYDLPADFNKLSTFVGSLTDAKVQRLVTSSADRIARLEFKDTKIELLDASDKPLLTVVLGKNADVGGGRYVRYGDEQKAYLTNLSAFLDADSKNWANAEILNLKADDIAKVEIPFAEGSPITVSRAKKEDSWVSDKTPANHHVKADKVSTVLSSIGTVRFSETTPTDDPAVAPAKANLRTFKLTTFDNKTVTVAMGRKPEEKKLKPVTSSDGKAGPAALGSVADLAKKAEKKEGDPASGDEKPLGPEFETVPAGPVYVFATHSDASAPVNTVMQKRAYQVSEFTFTGLPQKPEELFEPTPAAPTTSSAPSSAEKKTTEVPHPPVSK